MPRDAMSPTLARMLTGEHCTGHNLGEADPDPDVHNRYPDPEPNSLSGEMIRARDPFGIGLPDRWGLHLLRRLLMWNPHDRITAARALEHAYLRESGSEGYRCPGWVPGEEEFEFRDEMEASGCANRTGQGQQGAAEHAPRLG